LTTKITTWSPDTCKCTISYAWDDQDPPETRVHSYVSPQQAAQLRPDALEMDALGTVKVRRSGDVLGESTCEHHQDHKSRGMDMYSVLSGETQRKEAVRQSLKEFFTPAVLSHYLNAKPDLLDGLASTFQMPKALAKRFIRSTLATATDEEAQELANVLVDQNYAWEYDHERVLHVKVPMLEAGHKQALQSSLDSEHGRGQVVLH
jgi:hypothetical protein